ncbi:ion channel [Flavilitoribacter nigricans]|uniref:Transporter n=1 Tax=Flavilitoribacter nigricans (strain ATCC 23147 / DSM 23189 / NBRC 102662 / NCIMB 1420 / SS-2) TaxID=1122177 RepID=A0A2D0N4Y7_FLAN2|nr:ion channel [Flavilitoribacter nigricans]PHN03497.1 transporter [Flavilitoribacter nigricans DSM 23189 = NBRC 102662]
MKLSDLPNPFRRTPSTPVENDENQDDLGFGEKVITAEGRLINQDGSFNIRRRGYQSWAPYQNLVEMPWKEFALMVFLFYMVINALFALAFMACGRASLSGVDLGSDLFTFFSQCFFFSIQTFTTVGYGSISPVGFIPNFIAAIDALVGLMSFALATGLVFARFSKPKAQILFSSHAIITPYRHRQTEEMMNSLQFRIVNTRDNKLINLQATVIMTWLEVLADGKQMRRYTTLPLERYKVSLLPLNWTIVHPIDENSPLYAMDAADLIRNNTEIMIMIQGYDDTFAQNVHTNSSYSCREIKWGVKFAGMYHAEDGETILELDMLDTVLALDEEE